MVPSQFASGNSQHVVQSAVTVVPTMLNLIFSGIIEKLKGYVDIHSMLQQNRGPL